MSNPDTPTYWIEHQARLAGEAAYLAGDTCDLGECEARCASLLAIEEAYPRRGYRIFAYFVLGFNDMAACLETHGFGLSGTPGALIDLRVTA